MIPLYDQNPPRSPPVITRWLIYINVSIFLLQWLSGTQGLTQVLGFVPLRASGSFIAELPQAFTSMFLHAGVAHLAWNMLFLHIFGDNVEDLLGRGRFLLFYLLSGLAGAVGQYLQAPMSPIPMVGASGAIAGVLGGYLVLHPRAPVILLNPVPPLWLLMGPLLALPAWFVVGYWFFGNLMGGLTSLGAPTAGVAFFAHIGGFLAGLLLTRPMLLEGNQHPPPKGRQPLSSHEGRAKKRHSEPTIDLNGWRSPPHRVPERKIFWKDDKRPFWR